MMGTSLAHQGVGLAWEFRSWLGSMTQSYRRRNASVAYTVDEILKKYDEYLPV